MCIAQAESAELQLSAPAPLAPAQTRSGVICCHMDRSCLHRWVLGCWWKQCRDNVQPARSKILSTCQLRRHSQTMAALAGPKLGGTIGVPMRAVRTPGLKAPVMPFSSSSSRPPCNGTNKIAKRRHEAQAATQLDLFWVSGWPWSCLFAARQPLFRVCILSRMYTLFQGLNTALGFPSPRWARSNARRGM